MIDQPEGVTLYQFRQEPVAHLVQQWLVWSLEILPGLAGHLFQEHLEGFSVPLLFNQVAKPHFNVVGVLFHIHSIGQELFGFAG